MMEPDLQAFLSELHERGRAHDEKEPDRDKRMLNLKPETAQLVSILVRSSRRKHLLEIGTSNGYSTIWLAWSALATGGRLITVDHNAEKLAMADENLRHAGMRDVVELRHGDAAEMVRTLPGPYDFVFFDCARSRPELQLEVLLPKLTADALVLADNVLSHPAEMAPFLAVLEAQPAFSRVVVPVGKGLCVAHRGNNP